MTLELRSPEVMEEESSLEPLATPARKGGKLYFFATMFAMVAALLRYVALARLLGPAELGLAATIVVTSAFFDQISDTGSDRFMIQDADGEAPRVQHLVQLVFVCRGLLIASGFLIFAIPISIFFKSPQLAPGLMIFAVSPLLIGFMHMDNRRKQREHDFRTVALMTICGEVVSVVGTVVAAYLTRSFTAILFGLIARSFVMIAVSHLRAERPYRIGYDKEIGPRLAKFARPLVLTGVMLFVGSQSDRVIVGRQLGVTALGHYSSVLLLVYYPSSVFLSFIHSIYVPLVAGARDDPERRNHVIDTLGGQTMLLALAMMMGFALVAPIAVPLLYGARYREPAILLTLIGILQMWRFLIVAPTTTALSIGRSQTVLVGNLMRLLVFPGAYLGLATIGGFVGVVSGFAVAEAIAVIVETVLVARDTRRPLTTGLGRLAMFVLMCGGVLAAEVAWSYRSVTGGVAAAAVLLVLLAGFARLEAVTLRETVAMADRWFRSFIRRFRPAHADRPVVR